MAARGKKKLDDQLLLAKAAASAARNAASRARQGGLTKAEKSARLKEAAKAKEFRQFTEAAAAARGLPVPARKRRPHRRRPAGANDWPCKVCKRIRFETWEDHLKHQSECTGD
jgi:hypothetical protein